jgi:hypothetical protein
MAHLRASITLTAQLGRELESEYARTLPARSKGHEHIRAYRSLTHDRGNVERDRIHRLKLDGAVDGNWGEVLEAAVYKTTKYLAQIRLSFRRDNRCGTAIRSTPLTLASIRRRQGVTAVRAVVHDGIPVGPSSRQRIRRAKGGLPRLLISRPRQPSSSGHALFLKSVSRWIS